MEGHEKAAVGAASAREHGRGGDPLGHEVLGDRLEVLVRLVAIRLLGRLVPGGTELASASDVGLDVAAALLEPGGARRGLRTWSGSG